MPDPVTPLVHTIASIFSLVETSKSIFSWISDIQDAPKYVSNLRVFLLGFTVFLGGVERALRDANIAGKVSPEQINIIIRNAKETLRQLEVSFTTITQGRRGVVSRSRWLENRDKYRGLQESLAECRELFSGIINVAQLESLQVLIEGFCVILHREEARLLEFNSQAVDGFGGQAELLLEDASSSERPLVLDIGATTHVCPRPEIPQNGRDSDTVRTVVSQKLQRNAVQGQCCNLNCACNCHTTEKVLPKELFTKSNRCTNIIARFVRCCSIKSCMRKKRRPRGTYLVSAEVVNKAVGTSLIARGFHNRFFLKNYSMVPETDDSLRYVISGNLQAFKMLIEARPTALNNYAPGGWTPLHNAAYFGHLGIVKYLVGERADVKVSDVGGRTASNLARIRAFHKNATPTQHEIAQSLCNDDDVKFDFGFTSIHIVVLDAYGKDDTNRLGLLGLLRFIEDANNAPAGQNWMAWRKKYRDSPLLAEVIQEFYEASVATRGFQKLWTPGSQKPFLRLIDKRDERQGWSPFLWAAYTGRLDEMNTLLEHDADPFLISPMKRNALHQAAESKCPEIMERVLKIPPYGDDNEWFDINSQDRWGETPLHIAAEGSAELVKLLLTYDAQRDIRTKDKKIPLHYASHAKGTERYKIVDVLSEARGEVIDIREENGEQIDMHKDKEKEIDMRDKSGKTPIFDILDTPDCVQLLLDRGASTSLLDDKARSVFHHACMENQSESLKILLKAPQTETEIVSSPDEDGDVPLAKAFEFKSMECIKVLLEFNAIGDMNEKDGSTLAHRAAKLGDHDVLKCVFEHPTYKKGVKNSKGKSLLEVAYDNSTPREARELILSREAKGALVDRKGKGKSTSDEPQTGEPSSAAEA